MDTQNRSIRSGAVPDVRIQFIARKAVKYLIAFAKGRGLVKPRRELHCNISASLDSQDSSEANAIRERPHSNSIDGDESEEDPPEHKPSKLKRRQVTHYLPLRSG